MGGNRGGREYWREGNEAEERGAWNELGLAWQCMKVRSVVALTRIGVIPP